MQLEHFLTPYKRKLKWIKGLNVRPVTMKLLEENKGRIFLDINDINRSNIFLYLAPRAMKIKIIRWDLVKLKSFSQKRKA